MSERSSSSSVLPWLAAVATVAATAAAAYYYHSTNLLTNEAKIDPAESSPSSSKKTQQVDKLVQERFNSCIHHMKSQIPTMPQPLQLEFYALFKQASLGDIDDYIRKAPPAYDVVATAKYKAWKSLSGMTRTAAMQEYIDKAVHYEFTRSMLVNDDDNEELEGDAVMDMNGMGNKPSTLSAERTKEEEDADDEDDRAFPLHAAARNNQVAELERLLQGDKKHDPNELDKSGQTALHLAADAGHPDCIKVLVKYGADVQAADNDGITVLQAAVIAGHVETCRLLCVLGADPDQPDGDGDTPRECAKDDPVLRDLLFRASVGQLEIDPDFQKELEELGQLASPRLKAKEKTSHQAEISALDSIPIDLDDGDGDM